MQSLRAFSRSRNSIFHITSNQPWLSLITVSQQSHSCKANRWQHHLALDPYPSEIVRLQKLDGCDHGRIYIIRQKLFF
ncbi:hypothetical protein L6164_019660 [Bauhinia variegata]|uniref:Uncharacterized protein n=1 Tax=Bauhinia variegata TaxID=167791 RepID=A0ACB9MW01_BAUVA|nr:hypothetical protein L6164_019660 [Bauhinia variegata]